MSAFENLLTLYVIMMLFPQFYLRNFVLKEAMRSNKINSKGTNLIEKDNVQITAMK
jgi:hypothetical protein